MIFNEKELALAQGLTANVEVMRLLYKVFCPERTQLRDQLEKNVVALTNEEYGAQMKVLVLAERHFTEAYDNLVKAGKATPQGKAGANAPR